MIALTHETILKNQKQKGSRIRMAEGYSQGYNGKKGHTYY